MNVQHIVSDNLTHDRSLRGLLNRGGRGGGAIDRGKKLNTIIATTLCPFRTIYNPALYAMSGAVRLF